MSEQTNESTLPKKPISGNTTDELNEKELEKVSGGGVINPQPLPPRRMPD